MKVSSVITCTLYPFGVSGYFGYTHRFLGNSLADNLNDASKQFIEQYIGVNKLGTISTWADAIKRKPQFRWTQALHYIDLEACQLANGKYKQINPGIDDEITTSCHNNCIYSAIMNITNDLRYNREFLTREQTVTNTKLLIHFLQDLFQPMHTFGGHHTRGGNAWKIQLEFPNGKTKSTNMHTLWDSILPEYYIKNFHPVVSAQQPIRIRDIYQFEGYLKDKITVVLGVACRATAELDDNRILFSEYFKPEIFEQLFQHYIDFAVDTLAFITQPHQI